MWCRLPTRISSSAIDALLERAENLISDSQKDTSITFGKDFFGGIDAENNNLDLLQQLHQEFWPQITEIVNLNVPVVDDAILLIKGAGAPGTALHQDRAYWVSRDPIPTIFSVWIALEDLTEEKGGLVYHGGGFAGHASRGFILGGLPPVNPTTRIRLHLFPRRCELQWHIHVKTRASILMISARGL